MPTLTDAFVVNSKESSPLNANAPTEAASTQVSTFVTVQSFGTFAIAAPVLKTIWELIKALAGGWASSYWIPAFVGCERVPASGDVESRRARGAAR